jgi:SOS-response transcriptional repressor LexA
MQTLQRIPILAPVYAGAALPDDWQQWQIKKFRDIRLVTNVGQNERIVGVPVVGDSLNSIGIFHGDILVTKINCAAKPDSLCVWQTPHGRTAKFARENFDGTVTLHNENGWSQTWQPEDVKLIGIVIRIERDLE